LLIPVQIYHSSWVGSGIVFLRRSAPTVKHHLSRPCQASPVSTLSSTTLSRPCQAHPVSTLLSTTLSRPWFFSIYGQTTFFNSCPTLESTLGHSQCNVALKKALNSRKLLNPPTYSATGAGWRRLEYLWCTCGMSGFVS
jgi:hypothetical protein